MNIEFISIDKLIPHPDNPRKDLGDLTELADSIRETGIMQNLTVVPAPGDTYKIIIGHRRHAAAKLAGLSELPCIVTEMSEEKQLATMLLENMQRSDLTIVEQAQGMQMMLNIGFTADEIVKRTGFSRSTVDKRLKVAQLPHEAAKEAEVRGGTLADFVKLDKIKDENERNKLIEKIGTSSFEWAFNSAYDSQCFDENKITVENYLTKQGFEKAMEKYEWRSDYAVSSTIEIGKRFNADEFENRVQSLKKDVSYTFGNSYTPYVYFMEKRKTEKTSARSKTAIEADKVRAELENKNKATYERRQTFLGEFTAYEKHKKQIINSLIFITLSRAMDDQYSDYDQDYVEASVPSVKKSANTALKDFTESKTAEAAFTALVASFDDGINNDFSYMEYGETFPKYAKNQSLSLEYEILESIGFKISTEERQLIDGTHELYGYNSKRSKSNDT